MTIHSLIILPIRWYYTKRQSDSTMIMEPLSSRRSSKATNGVAHKNINSSHDFRVVGAYPAGQSWDMNYGKEGERPAADRNISAVPDPGDDQVYGSKSPLLELWKA
jgi:hypothetical protein